MQDESRGPNGLTMREALAKAKAQPPVKWMNKEETKAFREEMQNSGQEIYTIRNFDPSEFPNYPNFE